uniref:Nucleoside-diphosphate kinase n=1 Tax=Macrostomum lignano TaxID=282301 RepID=A0A1I8FF63_9PLAT
RTGQRQGHPVREDHGHVRPDSPVNRRSAPRGGHSWRHRTGQDASSSDGARWCSTCCARRCWRRPRQPGFLVDGYPRELDQAVRFEADLAPCRSVLFFNLDEAAMKLRLLKRGETSGRVDDNEATIVKRFQTFQKLTRPVVEHYEKQGKVVKVFQLVQKSLQKLGFKPVKNSK